MKKIYSVLSLFFIIQNSIAQFPGSLDPTFDNDGSVSLNMPTSPLPQVKSKHVLQPDGKIVICSNSNSPSSFFDTEVMVSRYNSNGSLDATFGTNGTFNYSVVTGYNLAVGIQLQPDGKIVTAGICNDFSGVTNNEIFLLRLNANGTLDSSFGMNGISRLNFSPDDERVTDLKRSADGGFVVAGFIISSVSSDSAYILKTKSNGILDSNFAVNGFFSYQHNDSQTDIYSVEVMPDKSLVAAGSYSSDDDYQDLFIMKLDSSGSFDSSFSGDGIYTRDLFNDYDEIHSLKRLSNGNLLAAGYSYDGLNDGSFVIKLDPAGNNVNSFGVNSLSYFRTLRTPNRAYSMDVQPNGKIVLAGEYSDTTTFSNDIMVLRLFENGMPDTTFNNFKPFVTTNFIDGDDNASSVLIQPDGKILVYGNAVLDPVMGDRSPVLVRYMGGEFIGGPLPLTLLNFSGVPTLNNIALKWTTIHEKNTDYFTVEKSNDGINFTNIARVYAKNNWGQMNDYSYNDTNLRTIKTYYRLRMTDKDNKDVYSKIISFSAKTKDDILVYPTITKSLFTIQSNKPGKFYLYNSQGQVVDILSAGNNNISTLPAGVYYVKTGELVFTIIKE